MKRAPLNLYELQPVRAVRDAVDPDGRTMLLVPKFTNRLLVRWLVPRLSKSERRVHLDELGSFVWQQCDGETSVEELGLRTAQHFGADVEAMQQRVAEFVAGLARAGHVTLRSGEPAPAP